MTLKYIWRSFSLGCHFHVHFSYPWHAFASHGLPAVAELLVYVRYCIFSFSCWKWCFPSLLLHYAQYTLPTLTWRNCRVESCWWCAHNLQLVGGSLDESEQICQQPSGQRCDRTRRQWWPSLQFPVLLPLRTRSLFDQFPNWLPNPSAVVVS